MIQILKGAPKYAERISYWSQLRRPIASFRRFQHLKSRNIRLLGLLLMGYALCLVWADLFNLGKSYETGQIFSVILILGPIIGVLELLGFSVLLRGFSSIAKPRQIRTSIIFAWASLAAKAWVPLALMAFAAHLLFVEESFVAASPWKYLLLVLALPTLLLQAYPIVAVLPGQLGWSKLKSSIFVALSWLIPLPIIGILLSFLTGIRLF